MSSRTAFFRTATLLLGPALLLWAAPCTFGEAAPPQALQATPDPNAWHTASDLPQVDFSGLTAAQKTTALKVLRDYDCACQCGMKVAECRLKDPKCYYSRGLSQVIINSLKAGKSEADARKAAQESDYARAQQAVPLLEPAVSISLKGAPSVGPENAPITLVEFSDFQCPYCAVAAPELHRVVRAFPDQIRLVFKQFPLEIHPLAPLAAAAAVAADKQGKFWDMHDAMFSHRHSLNRDGLMAAAQDIGLDMDKFTADLASATVKGSIEQDLREGDQIGIQGTPTLFINGQRYNGPLNLLALRTVLEKNFKAKPAPEPTAAVAPKAE